MKFILFLTSYFLIHSINAFSQTSIRPLSIGDTVPDIVLNHLINYKTPSARLSDFRGKLVILDFWATWCSSCIANFPKMGKLEKEFNGKLQVLGVTKEKIPAITNFFSTKRNANGDKYSLATIVQDTIFNKLFPHIYIPHSVWIDTNGVVKAVTSADGINDENIRNVLSKNGLQLSVKKDLDTKRPLFLSEDYPSKNDLLYYSILSKGNYSGLGTGNRFFTKDSILYGRAITNSGILKIYEAAVYPLFNQLNDNYIHFKRLILNVKDSAKIIVRQMPDNTFDNENEYNFDIIVPIKEADSLYSYMLADLNRYSGFYGRIEKRKVKCFTLVRNGSADKLKTAGQTPAMQLYQKPVRLINTPLKQLLIRLNIEENIPLSVVDETGYTENVDMELTGNFDLPTLRKELNRYGLGLVETEREMNMFVLSEKE